MHLIHSPEFIKRIPLTNKDQDIKFEVYECNNSKHQNISLFNLVCVFLIADEYQSSDWRFWV